MGAWDETAFGNDGAGDWAAQLAHSDQPVEFLKQTLAQASDEEEYLERDEGSAMVAAAAVVAAAQAGGNTLRSLLPSELMEWLQGREAELRPLAPDALTALQRVRGEGSELKELWEETDDFAAWNRNLDAISTALASHD